MQPSVTVRVQRPGQCASLQAVRAPVRAPDSFGHAQHLLIKEVGSLMSLTPGPVSFRCEHGILCILRHLIRVSCHTHPRRVDGGGRRREPDPLDPGCPTSMPGTLVPPFFLQKKDEVFCPLTQFCLPVSYFEDLVPTLSSAAAGHPNMSARHLICPEPALFSQNTQYVLDQSQVHSAHGNLHYYIAAHGDLILSSSM